MIPAPRRLSRAPRRHRLDQAARALLRVVMVHGWRPDKAALELRARLDDDRLLLHLLHARVAEAMLDRPTLTDQRAFATLEHALAGPRAHARGDDPWLPRQRRAHD